MPDGLGAFFPAWSADAAGNFYVAFDVSGPKLNPSIYAAARRSTDPGGTMSALRELERGKAPPEGDGSSGHFTAYGDFSGATFDPQSGVWVASQYGRTVSKYGTIIANVSL
jgi:hypothetical protein